MANRARLSLIALGCLVALPTTAVAQSAMAGVVKDASGAVLPGVTVEGTSPVLIEKTRSVVTYESRTVHHRRLTTRRLQPVVHVTRLQRVQARRD